MSDELPTGIDRLPSGRFRYRIQHNKKTLSGIFATPEEAAAVRDEVLRGIASGSVEFVEGETIAAIGIRFLATRKGNRYDDSGRWNKHIAASAIARRAPGSITRPDVLEWWEALAQKTTDYDEKLHGKRVAKLLAFQTRKHCFHMLSRFFEYCLDHHLVTSNPCAGIVLERQDGDEDEGWQEEWYLTAKDQADIFAFRFEDEWMQADWEREKLLVRVTLGTGLRIGELHALHLADVHLTGDNPHLFIRYGSWDAKGERFRPPKSKKGVRRTRSVPLWGDALTAMKAWMAIVPTSGKKNKYGLVAPSSRGGRRTKPHVTWLEMAKSVGVNPRLGRRLWWHLLRHTCATSLLSGTWGMRWSIEDVSKMLGHSSIGVTQRYAKVVETTLTETAGRADVAWQASRHAAVTPAKNAERLRAIEGLRSRRSQVRILSGAPAVSQPSHRLIVRLRDVQRRLAVSQVPGTRNGTRAGTCGARSAGFLGRSTPTSDGPSGPGSRGTRSAGCATSITN